MGRTKSCIEENFEVDDGSEPSRHVDSRSSYVLDHSCSRRYSAVLRLRKSQPFYRGCSIGAGSK